MGQLPCKDNDLTSGQIFFSDAEGSKDLCPVKIQRMKDACIISVPHHADLFGLRREGGLYQGKVVL